MNETRTLSLLQAIDLQLDKVSQELETLLLRIGETDELVAARQQLDDSRAKHHEIHTAQKELEYEIDRLSEKIMLEEKALYHGKGQSSRELDGLRRGIESVKANRREVEDRVLDLMAELEQAQANVQAASSEMMRVSADWEESQRVLASRQEETSVEQARLTQERLATAARVSSEALTQYEELRRMKQGRAVAKIERNTCQGCRISLPMNTVQHARLGREMVFCPSCSRILISG